MGGSARKRPRKAALRIRRKKDNAAGETAMEKPLRGKVANQTFPPSLQIAQKARDSHFPTAATTAGLRLHFQCLDGRPQGYIFKWLDALLTPTPREQGKARPQNKKEQPVGLHFDFARRLSQSYILKLLDRSMGNSGSGLF
jgi:hypothetical protein